MMAGASAAPAFPRFIAIDWSGARGKRYAGIAVAECRDGDAPPVLVDGPGGWWSRTALFDWLKAELAREPALVGIDCAFSLPFAVAARGFPAGEAATSRGTLRGSRSAVPAGQSASASTATVATTPCAGEPPTCGRGNAMSATVDSPPTASRKRLGSPAACSAAAVAQ